MAMDLKKAKLKIDGLFIFNIDKNGESQPGPLKLHGYLCYATVKITSYKDRVKGLGDAEIVIDAEVWDRIDEPTKKAIIDHELTHLLSIWDAGALVTDDAGRPKLQLKLHDYHFGGFESIAKRHGASSIEVQTMQSIRKQYGPLFDLTDAKPSKKVAA